MKKQTAVEFLIQQIELALKLNKVQINFEYRVKTINPVYEIARKMEREQIGESFCEGSKLMECPNELSALFEFELYYNETFKGVGQ